MVEYVISNRMREVVPQKTCVCVRPLKLSRVILKKGNAEFCFVINGFKVLT